MDAGRVLRGERNDTDYFRGRCREARAAANRRHDTLTNPLGALGRLEPLAAQVCAVQRTLTPAISHPVAVVFAGDHGVVDRRRLLRIHARSPSKWSRIS